MAMLLRTACILLVTIGALAGAGEPLREFQVEANYLVTLPMFVDFPDQALAAPVFTIGLMGDTALGPELEAFKSRLVKNRPMVIRVIQDGGQVAGCQVVFIASSERYRLQALLPDLHRQGILTISDMRDFVHLGGMVGLVADNNHISFTLNLAAARATSLSFGTRLLKLASEVTN